MNKNEVKWLQKYELARGYYEHYGNLNMPQKFKTKNGYEYDEDGVALGRWIDKQRMSKNGIGSSKITEKQVELLNKIEMIWVETKNDRWNKYYELARNYYEYYDNLDVLRRFKTKNGYDYFLDGLELGIWISNQRSAYKGKSNHLITDKQIKLLEDIKMVWFSEYIDDRLQAEEIITKNRSVKQIEILNRCLSYLNTYEGSVLPSKDEINEGFLYKLEHKYVKKR